MATTTIPIPAGLDPQQPEKQAAALPPPDDGVLTNDGWFPDIDLSALRVQYRVRDAIPPARLREAALFALEAVANELDTWAGRQRASGYASLADVPAAQRGGESRLVTLYRRAVGSETRALLIEGQRDTDLTGTGQRQVNDLTPSIAELRRDRVHAVRNILGKGRTTVELL